MQTVFVHCEHARPFRVSYEGIAPEPSTGSPGYLHWEWDLGWCPHGCEPTEDQVVAAVERYTPRREDFV